MNNQFNCFRLRNVSAAAIVAFAAASAWAVQPFTVRDIRVEGLQRVEPGTVFASLPIHVGDTYTDEKGSAAIRALFALGLFKDVRLETSGNVLIVVVEERPTVADVEFTGAKEFDAKTLKKSMTDIGLTEGRPFDKSLADRAVEELKREYISRSLYGVQIVTTVTPIERNRVNVTFSITEGQPAKIKQINIVGNKAFSESTLRDLFNLDTGGWMSWYTKANRYSRTKLNADLETLRSYYLARGYLEFKVDSTQVAISPDKRSISITINVTEGERYVVTGVKLEGNYLGKEDEFKSLIKIRPGEPYDADEVAKTTKAFTDLFANFGFAFARVDARPEIDRANGRVAFTLVADPSRRVYVRRINISGNDRTRDEVIRREFRQFESSWYDGDKIKLSRDRVDRLGFFTDVTVTTQEVPGVPDEVDLNVHVKEKPTGSLTLGAGYGSADKLSLSFGISQENAFGSGNSLGLQVNTSKYNRVIVVSTTNPYFTKDGVSRTIDVYHKYSQPYEDQGGNYSLTTEGASLRFGVPFSETDRVYFGAGIERTRIDPGTSIPAVYLQFADRFGYSSTEIPLTIGWSRDSRDSALVPTDGTLQRFNGEWGAGGAARYVKADYQYQQYIPLNKKFSLVFAGELGLGKGLNGEPFPVFKNFYGGGLGSVRGFEQGTLGPRDVTGFIVGGTKKVVLSTELDAPFPGAGNDRTLRVFGFVDVGNIYGDNEPMLASELRASTGLGLSWISPLGPLKFAIAQPLRKFAGDRIQRLQFQIGTSF
ncbi:MAG: outer membrane protein assembly factor BamA [Burkholderiaceae bacterium]|nr:outer membrane protein assembly factor BamA [Burkholderiales bacterium]TAL65434.1 MAG: outer membrane protein assembly factor BamA [Burkholderiaceae bacterium]TBR75260.1 MAG: outer membrane protein assembly factor BamA [Burkholderiaceae bacterium]